MNRRLLLATLAVALLAFTSGCVDDGLSDDQLDEDAEYNWSVQQDVYIDVSNAGSLTSDAEFKAVYDVSGQDKIELYRSGVTSDRPLEISAVKFRRANGSFVNGSELSVEQTDDRTVIDPPSDDGKLAFTSETDPKELRLPAYVEGSYRVALPPDHSTEDFLLGHVSPRSGYRTERVDGRVHVVWSDVSSPIHLKYYVDRDRYFFYGLVVSLGLVALGGYFYFNRQIRKLKERRKEHGLELDPDDDGKRPPPGMG